MSGSNSTFAIVNVGGENLQAYLIAFGIGDDTTLASLDPIARIEPTRTVSPRGFDGLSVDHSCGLTDLAA